MTGMTTHPFLPQRSHSDGGYFVRGPQVGDILGGALRNAYGTGVGLPDDMQRVLTRLDRIPAHH